MGVMETEVIQEPSTEHIETAPQQATFERHSKEAKQTLDIMDEYAPLKKSLISSLNGKKKHKQDRI
jgi:V/A-type H+-transporting ATPase subunit I